MMTSDRQVIFKELFVQGYFFVKLWLNVPLGLPSGDGSQKLCNKKMSFLSFSRP